MARPQTGNAVGAETSSSGGRAEVPERFRSNTGVDEERGRKILDGVNVPISVVGGGFIILSRRADVRPALPAAITLVPVPRRFDEERRVRGSVIYVVQLVVPSDPKDTVVGDRSQRCRFGNLGVLFSRAGALARRTADPVIVRRIPFRLADALRHDLRTGRAEQRVDFRFCDEPVCFGVVIVPVEIDALVRGVAPPSRKGSSLTKTPHQCSLFFLPTTKYPSLGKAPFMS